MIKIPIVIDPSPLTVAEDIDFLPCRSPLTKPISNIYMIHKANATTIGIVSVDGGDLREENRCLHDSWQLQADNY